MKHLRNLFLFFILFFSFHLIKAETLNFLGIPFGKTYKEFNSILVKKNNFKFLSNSYFDNNTEEFIAEFEGDFWKWKDCIVYLYSYSKGSSKFNLPIVEATVFYKFKNKYYTIDYDKRWEIFKELIKDLISKYGIYSHEIDNLDDFGIYMVKWSLKNGEIVVNYKSYEGICIDYISDFRLKQLTEKYKIKGHGIDDL